MPSDAQVRANRENAKRSTGPRTPEGRARSSMNALKSGIFAESEIIPGEDPAELDALKSRLYESLQPTPEEATLVDAVARADWQLRRFSRVEAQIWTDRIEVQQKPRAPLSYAYTFHPEHLDRLYRQQAATARTLRNSLETLLRLRKAGPLLTPDETNPIPLEPAPCPQPPVTESAETNPIPAEPVPDPPGEAAPVPESTNKWRNFQPNWDPTRYRTNYKTGRLERLSDLPDPDFHSKRVKS